MNMRSLIVALFLIAACSSAHAAYDGTSRPTAQREMLADRVVAKVNNAAITLSELEEARIERGLADPESRTRPRREIYEEELARLIDDELIYQIASQNKIDAPPEMVVARVKEIVASLDQALGSRENVEAMLAEQGLTLEKLKELIQKREEKNIVIMRAVSSRFTITEADVKEFEGELLARGEAPAGYLLRHILIAVPKDASAEEVNALREQIYKIAVETQGEMSFAEAARMYSQDAKTRDSGGDLGYVAEGSMMPELERVVKKLEIGQVSQPVRSETGWHVFKLENVRSARKMLFAKRFEEERLNLIAQLRRTMTVETQMEFLDELPEEKTTAND